MEALSKQAIRIVRLFGNTEATKVLPSVGAEQEYFLVDSAKALQREDIIFAGRTLLVLLRPRARRWMTITSALSVNASAVSCTM